MKADLTIEDKIYTISLDEPISIGIPLNPFDKNPSCFYAGQPGAAPMEYDGFVCSVEAGAPVNFYSLNMVPHGHGTHTECLGHITSDFQKVNELLSNSFMLAELITVDPEQHGDDRIISGEQLADRIKSDTPALIIRTTPNSDKKNSRNYTESNPPFLAESAMQYIVDRNIQHLLLDLPSVDKEKDDGAVRNHKLFWNIEGQTHETKTITEMIFVPNQIMDGRYVLNLQISNIALDAVPSWPLLYRIHA